MTPQKFSAAVARGMQASPFATTAAVPLYVITGTSRRALTGCTIRSVDNVAKAEEYGLDRKYTIEARIPKTILPSQPDRELHKVEYKGRRYDLDAVHGDAEFSPCWVITASCPLKA